MMKPVESFNYDKCPVPVVVFKKKGPELCLTYWNPAMVRMTGSQILRSDVMAKKIFARSSHILEDLNRCLRTGKSFQSEREHRFQHINKTCHYLATYNPLPGNHVEVFLVDITRQKMFEDKMSFGRDTVSRLVKYSDFTLIICENDLRIRYYIGPERYGLNNKGVIGKRLDRLVKIKNIDDIRSAVRKVYENEECIYHDEKRYLINDKEFWMNDNFYPVPEENNRGRLVGYIGRDITRLKEMENRLMESEVRYQNIYENLQCGICYCEFERRERGRGAGFTILDVNPAFARIFGKPGQDFVGKRGETVFQPIARDIVKNRETLFEKRTLSYEWERCAEGKYLRAGVFHVQDACFMIAIEDITEKKEAENRILRSEKKYREITDLVRVMILDVDSRFNIVFMNEYARGRLFPGAASAGENVNLSDIVEPKDKEKLMASCGELMNGKEAEVRAFHLKNSEGARIFALSNAVLIRNGDKIEGVRLAVFELNEIASSIVFPDAELNRKYNLSKRESDVLFSQISGLTDQDIAEKLFISKPTVRFHITNLYNKLGVNNKRELFEFMKDNFVRKMGYENLLIYILNSFVRD